MALKRQLRAIVHGRVQGVGYRYATAGEGRALRLAGFARNLPDGSVEVVASGEESALLELLRYLHRGPTLARVTSVDVDWNDSTPELPEPFSIRH
jgi:acylphosphatase